MASRSSALATKQPATKQPATKQPAGAEVTPELAEARDPIGATDLLSETATTTTSAAVTAQVASPAADRVAPLVAFVRETAGTPLNQWAVAAVLESRGLRDIDAINDYNHRHIFHLAGTVLKRIRAEEAEETALAAVDRVPRPGLGKRVAEFARFYSKGMFFALPMAGQIAAVLVLRYSLWAWLDFSTMQASLVAIGTMASFIVTGGLTQIIGRQGTFYAAHGNYILLARICRIFAAIGIGIAFTTAAILVISNSIWPYFTIQQLVIVLIYLVLMTPLWTFLAILYMLQDNLAILICTIVGTGAVHLIMKNGWGSIHTAHAVGLVVATAVAALWAAVRIIIAKRKVNAKHRLAKLPRASVLAYIAEPFFLYGTLYFGFMATDRLIAWSASEERQPLFIWFRAPYELGMDWALLSLILTLAVLEYVVNVFNLNIIPIQKLHRSSAYRAHNRYFLRFYWRHTLLLALVSTLSIAVTYVGVSALARLGYVPELQAFFASPVTNFTFWSAAFGYGLWAFGLFNALFFFSLSRPRVVVRGSAIGLAVNVLVGFVLSRMIAYEFAVFGLIAGAAVFAWIVSREAQRMFSDLDYYYYAAF